MKNSDYFAITVLLLGVACFSFFDATLCPMAGLVGVPCPSCGLTRATWLLLKAHPKEAFAMHPGIVVVWPYLFSVLGDWVFSSRLRGYDGKTINQKPLTVLGGVVFAVILWLWFARFAGFFGGAVTVKKWF